MRMRYILKFQSVSADLVMIHLSFLHTKSVTSSASPGTRKMPSECLPLSCSTASAKKGTILGNLSPLSQWIGNDMIKSRLSPKTEGLKGASYIIKDGSDIGEKDVFRRSFLTLARSISAAVKTFPLAPRAHIRSNFLDTCSLMISTLLAHVIFLCWSTKLLR